MKIWNIKRALTEGIIVSDGDVAGNFAYVRNGAKIIRLYERGKEWALSEDEALEAVVAQIAKKERSLSRASSKLQQWKQYYTQKILERAKLVYDSANAGDFGRWVEKYLAEKPDRTLMGLAEELGIELDALYKFTSGERSDLADLNPEQK